MGEKNFVININHTSEIPKYQQLINSINHAIAKNTLQKGDLLPSINYISKKNNLSRDTVFKAYSVLKDQRVIKSVATKGYFVDGEIQKVLLVLDTIKAYKEVLYHSFITNLPENTITDVQFHQYKIDNFKTIINNSIGKYYKYIVMNFDDREIIPVLKKIPNEKLLLIDWKIQSKPKNNFAVQDFGEAFYNSLLGAIDLFRKYEEILFVYPTFSNHPKESLTFFKKLAKDFKLNYKIVTNTKDFNIEKNKAYISVSDRILGKFLEQCREKNLEPGKDIGFLSYNETPMKKFIYKGISVVSTDFKEMGVKSAEFITNERPMQHYITTNLILRESL